MQTRCGLTYNRSQYRSVKPKTLGRDAKFRVSTGVKSAPKILNPSVLQQELELFSKHIVKNADALG